MDVGHQDVTTVERFVGGLLDGLGHITIGDRAEQHVVAASLLLHREAADGVEGRAEGFRLGLEGRLALRLLRPAVLHLPQHRRRHWHRLAGGHQKIPGIARSHLHQVAILAQAQHVLVENDLYALGHDGDPRDGWNRNY